MAICAALVKFDYKEPSIQQIAEYNNFSESEVKMMEVFWSDNFNENWIYLSDEMILNNMTNETKKNALSNFYTQVLFINFTINVDYKEIKKDDELIKKYDNIFGSLKNVNQKNKAKMTTKKYYAITGETYKELLILSANKKGKEARKYYLKIEKLAMFYHMYISELHKYLSKQKDKELHDEKEKGIRMHKIHIELLSYKKQLSKEESIYIVASYQYAIQGIFKVGRTKCMKARTSGHNNTHITGDKFKVLHEFKVNDATIIEAYIHKKLKGLLIDGEKEFFMCPYDLLENIIDIIINNDDNYNSTINNIIDTVLKLKVDNFNNTDWTKCINMDIFKDEMKLVTSDSVIQAKFDITNASIEQRENFVKGCIESYNKNIKEPNQMAWKLFQPVLRNYFKQNKVPIKKYKALEWRPIYTKVLSNDSQ